MTELLEKALEAVRKMPSDAQDSIAEAMLSLVGIGAMAGDAAAEIAPEHLAAVLGGGGCIKPNAASLRQMRRSPLPFAALSREAPPHGTRAERHRAYRR